VQHSGTEPRRARVSDRGEGLIMEDHKEILRRQDIARRQAEDSICRTVGINIHAVTFKTAYRATRAHLLSSTSMTRA
jgi:hypothetical protein